MLEKQIQMSDNMTFKDASSHEKHGLHGHVTIYRRHKQTGETTLWYENDNIIPISGMQYILMKMFGLYFDASHHLDNENLGQDTNLVIPELNQSSIMGIGTDPSQYTVMEDNISARSIVQGFMIGNGGSGEDQMTTKNTDYSFIKLRNPIPFRQTNELLEDGKYLGKLRVGQHEYTYSYYIKRFDKTPHIFHSWWRDGQRWDDVDPVTQNDLGPNAVNGAGKTNRIETYAQCRLVLDESDCAEFFAHEGNNQTPAINELGLVAFDTTADANRIVLQSIYNTYVKPILDIVFDDSKRTPEDEAMVITFATRAVSEMSGIVDTHYQSNIDAFYVTLQTIAASASVDFSAIQTQLKLETNIGVVPYYTNTDGVYVYSYETDTFLDNIKDDAFNDDSDVEAQRIKLVTYYTFKSIPIEENWETLIDYRIYAN